MATGNRPLSPHLQIYRPQITSVLSILNRGTGVALTIGTLLLVYWLAAAAAGPRAFANAQSFMGSFVGQFVLFGWTFSLFYHLAGGIRHLAWDAGWGYEVETATVTGWLAIGLAAALTVITWIAGYIIMGT